MHSLLMLVILTMFRVSLLPVRTRTAGRVGIKRVCGRFGLEQGRDCLAVNNRQLAYSISVTTIQLSHS
jgi:hypothetical protein